VSHSPRGEAPSGRTHSVADPLRVECTDTGTARGRASKSGMGHAVSGDDRKIIDETHAWINEGQMDMRCAMKGIRGLVSVAMMGLIMPSPVMASLGAVVRDPVGTGQVELRAELDDFNAQLLASSSATVTLETWCAAHHLANNPHIVAHLIDHAPKSASHTIRQQLHVGPKDVLRYRHVALSCGDHTLSEADNWYVPSRLTPEMNHQLETSDIPFGRVIKPLGATRRTLSATLLWQSLKTRALSTDRYHTIDHPHFSLPAHLLRHRAVLITPQGLPIAEVVETYTKALFDEGGAP